MNAQGRGYPSLNRLIWVMTLTVAAAPSLRAEDFTYTTNAGTITITGYTGPGGQVTIPDTIGGLPVTGVGNSAFIHQTSVTAVTLGTNLTSIGDSAFRSCTNLMNIEWDSRVSNIATYAFTSCALTNLVIPDSITNIGMFAFAYCGRLTGAALGNGLTSIGNSAFYNCTSLTNLTMGKRITRVGNSAFDLCKSLFSVSIGSGVTTLGAYAFHSCTNLSRVIIPRGFTTFEYQPFGSCQNLKQVYFLGNVPLAADGNVFLYNSVATIYYLPGTTGWGPTLSGHPTALWNPTIDTASREFGPQPAGFGLPITGTTNLPIVLEASSDLAAASWTPLLSGSLTNGAIPFIDEDWTNHPARFYRIRSP